MGDEELSVFLLPLMSMGLHAFVFQVRLKVGSLMEEDPEEKVRVEVAVDGDFVVGVVGANPTVIAQFRHSLASDVEVDLVSEEVVVDPVDRLRRQVVPQNGSITLLCRHPAHY